MTCKNCGAELVNNVKFCTSCGTPVEAPMAPQMPPMGYQPQPVMAAPQPVPQPAKKAKGAKLPCFLGMGSGLISIIMAIYVFSMYYGSYVSSKSYGGDAYTGIQNAAASTANNIRYAAEILQFSTGSILLVFGLAAISYFWIKLRESKNALQF